MYPYRQKGKQAGHLLSTGPSFIPQQFADIFIGNILKLTKHISFVRIMMFYNSCFVWFGFA